MQDGMMDCMSGMMQGGGMMGTMVLWGLLALVLLIGLITAVVLGIIWLARRASESTGLSTKSTETPLEILKRRLAQGEITLEQFETMKHQLQEG